MEPYEEWFAEFGADLEISNDWKERFRWHPEMEPITLPQEAVEEVE